MPFAKFPEGKYGAFELRRYKKGDEKKLAENINDKSVSRYTLRIPFPYSLSDAKSWIRHCSSEDKKKEFKELNLAIIIKGEVAGGISFFNLEGHKAEIGYWLAKKYWNRGVMTKAVEVVSRFGFYGLKLNRIYAPVFYQNNASAKVLENNGFALEGIMKKNCFKNGKFYDAKMYAKVR